LFGFRTGASSSDPFFAAEVWEAFADVCALVDTAGGGCGLGPDTAGGAPLGVDTAGGLGPDIAGGAPACEPAGVRTRGKTRYPRVVLKFKGKPM
jgi:hypothetical protein